MELNTHIGIETFVDLTGEGLIGVSVYTEDGDNELATCEFSITSLVEDMLAMYVPSDPEDLAQMSYFLSQLQYELGRALARANEEYTRIQTGAYDGR